MTIQEYPLAWRWTQSSHAVLPPDVLARIRPLGPVEAAEIHERSGFPRGGTVDSYPTTKKADVWSWLRRVQPDLRAEVLVSWSEELAVEMSWEIFTEYWEDFCYPSSDEVTIVPVEGKWRLSYHHYEQFDFANGR